MMKGKQKFESNIEKDFEKIPKTSGVLERCKKAADPSVINPLPLIADANGETDQHPTPRCDVGCLFHPVNIDRTGITGTACR